MKPEQVSASETELFKPKIVRRATNPEVENQALKAGLHPIAARVLANRPLPDVPFHNILRPRLAHLRSPFTLVDCDRGAERLCQAILRGEIIGVETDHDCDGQTSHAVMVDTLSRRFLYPREKIRSYIGHRLTEGYGLSDAVADRILSDDPRPSLILTADNGSSDEPRIARLKAAGIEVIVTDHHEIPVEGFPKSAFACLNPTRADCHYQDPYIAGCMVAWNLMAATRQKLIEAGYFPEDFPNLADCLDFVAVGTIADCVSMARSQTNRAVLRHGLSLIDRETRPCWQVLNQEFGHNTSVQAKDLAFKIGPLLNSDGRLSSAYGSVSLLLADSVEEADKILRNLLAQNENRKKIQANIVARALENAEAKVKAGQHALCIYLEDGHVGVQGIAASRITEALGRPTVIFSDKLGRTDSALITGSVRGISPFHVREALQWVDSFYPGLILAFGGHKGAGGLTIARESFEQFSDAFELAAIQQLRGLSLGPEILSDGTISSADLNLELVEILSQLEPFGREFETPVFDFEATLLELKAVGQGQHAKVSLEYDQKNFNGIWFSARKNTNVHFPVNPTEKVRVAFTAVENVFRGRKSLDLHILTMQKLK